MDTNGLKLSGALEEYSITSQYLGSKVKSHLFEEIECFSAFLLN